MIDSVVSIVTEVRNKLLYRACYHFQIIDIKNESDSAESDSDIKISVQDYRDRSISFDRFIYSMWKYLDLLTKTSVQIEDLYLNLLYVLNLERPNKYTIFRAVHWQSYRNVILSDSIIRQIVGVVDEWRDSGYA
jgi:hypothetical protein